MRTKCERIPTLEEFLARANGKRKTRIFDASDYARFWTAVAKARCAARRRKPYYAESDAGGVASSYFRKCFGRAYTAQWGVWTWPSGEIRWFVSTVTLTFGGDVPCAYPYGEKAYKKEFTKRADAIASVARPIADVDLPALSDNAPLFV